MNCTLFCLVDSAQHTINVIREMDSDHPGWVARVVKLCGRIILTRVVSCDYVTNFSENRFYL
jgi:hypothetical protein